jgi:hypothetical protein
MRVDTAIRDREVNERLSLGFCTPRNGGSVEEPPDASKLRILMGVPSGSRKPPRIRTFTGRTSRRHSDSASTELSKKKKRVS